MEEHPIFSFELLFDFLMQFIIEVFQWNGKVILR